MTGPNNSLRAIFNQAVELADSAERAAFLQQACGQDAQLRRRVEDLLRAHEQAGGFLESPANSPSRKTIFVSLPPGEKPGDKIGRYKLREQIGEGGCGTVYVAEQEEPVRRKVALKVIKLGMDTRNVIARFEAERQALAMMDHPNIAKVLDAGATETGRPYFVMELVRGIKITDYCDQNNLSMKERLDLFIQVCHAIQHAHQKGIIHRDIKPSNILVTLHDGEPVPKVIDFGIAKATEGRLTDATVYTELNQFIGTPAYMSPEQAEMSALDIDTRSDIYSLGVLLYELLTGRTPFDAKELLAEGLDAMRQTIREQEPARPSTRLSTMLAADLTMVARHRRTEAPKLIHLIRGDMDWIVMKALEKNRTRRYETATSLARDIQRHLGNEAVTARPPSNLYLLEKMVRRNKLVFAAGSVVALALLAGLGVATWSLVQEKKARQVAETARQEQERLRVVADADRKKAETEASKSRQVAQFLGDMLQSVGPSVALGRDTTMLREILDKTAERAGKDLKNQPEVRAELITTIGTTYFELGDARKAVEIHREALRLRRELFGETNVFVAESLKELGDALEMANEFDAAITAHRESLGIRRKLFVGDHPDVARSLTSLGGLFSTMARSNADRREGEAALREALAIQRRLFPEGHEDVAETLNNLALVLGDLGRSSEAEAIDREGLELQRKLRGTENPEVATTLTRLGRDLRAQGRLAEAELLLRDGYQMRKKFLGSDHPYVVSSLDTFVNVLFSEGKFADAETWLRDNLASRLQTNTGPAAFVLGDLTSALLGQGKLSEADGAHREALAISRNLALKIADSSEPMALNDAAWFLATCEEATFRDGPRAVQLAEKAVQATHRKDTTMLDTLAAAYAEAGEFEKAVSVQKEAMSQSQDKQQEAGFASRLKLYASHKPYRISEFKTRAADSLASRAFSLLREGKAAEAEPLARECLAIREHELPEDWRTFNTRSMVGGSLLGQKKYADAEPLLRSGYEGMKQREEMIPSFGKVRLKEAVERLVHLYEAWGKPDEAAAWQQKLGESR